MSAVWKLEDAKARFSEVVRRARAEGPQRVTVRGRELVAVVPVELLEQLKPSPEPGADLVRFLEALTLPEVERDRDRGRDFDFG